ncbi:MAG TPA: DoxX family protein [Candidatus Thermoplasmatota archaeon]
MPETASMVPVRDPPLVAAAFGSTQVWPWVWLVARVYIGYEWLQAGLHKVTDGAWMNGGVALQKFWERAVQQPEPPARAPIAFDWYRDFIQFLLDGGHYAWFAKVIAVGETLVGLGLLVGALTGIAAFCGGLLNWNFMMAGTASTNPVLFLIAILLMLAWKNAGWIGLDRWLLPWIGTPWQRGKLFDRHRPEPPELE